MKSHLTNKDTDYQKIQFLKTEKKLPKLFTKLKGLCGLYYENRNQKKT